MFVAIVYQTGDCLWRVNRALSRLEDERYDTTDATRTDRTVGVRRYHICQATNNEPFNLIYTFMRGYDWIDYLLIAQEYSNYSKVMTSSGKRFMDRIQLLISIQDIKKLNR